MVDQDGVPTWLNSNDEMMSLEIADTPAPFQGYMPFFNGTDEVGYRLLFSGRAVRAVSAVVQEDDDIASVWLEFREIVDMVRLDYQPIEVHSCFVEFGQCTIIARSDDAEEIYKIPVRIEMLKAPDAISTPEVSNGVWSSNASSTNGDGCRAACKQANERAETPLL
ncbi:hypothetical protein [Rhodopseudomonas palustris]|uniref:hypothetical protein n=1 Tax=Rhodopseudomonas palustris TaxID=1076 RepID=UPI000641DED7|nr:hypothetical protein [Rhodopseudomonas palustris]